MNVTEINECVSRLRDTMFKQGETNQVVAANAALTLLEGFLNDVSSIASSLREISDNIDMIEINTQPR